MSWLDYLKNHFFFESSFSSIFLKHRSSKNFGSARAWRSILAVSFSKNSPPEDRELLGHHSLVVEKLNPFAMCGIFTYIYQGYVDDIYYIILYLNIYIYIYMGVS